MSRNKRSHYRIRGDQLDGLHCELSVHFNEVNAEVMDISASGVAVLIPGGGANLRTRLLGAAAMRKLHLVLKGPRVGRTLVLDLEPVHMHVMDRGLLMGARLSAPRGEHDSLDARLLQIFNRRGALRVEPTVAQPVPVRLATSRVSDREPALVRDLSLSGVGVLMDAERLEQFEADEIVTVTLDLPKAAEPLTLSGAVRHSRVLKDAEAPVRGPRGVLGIAFDEVSLRRPLVSKELCRWVTERQLADREVKAEKRRRRVEVKRSA